MKSELITKIAGMAESDPRLARMESVLAGASEAPEKTRSMTLLTAAESARRLGVSATTFWRMSKAGTVKAIEIRPGSKRYSEHELLNLSGDGNVQKNNI